MKKTNLMCIPADTRSLCCDMNPKSWTLIESVK